MQSTQILGHQAAETARTSKSQPGTICRGETERGYPGKKHLACNKKMLKQKQNKNKQKTPGKGTGGSTCETPQPPLKKRALLDLTADKEETFMSTVKVRTMAC